MFDFLLLLGRKLNFFPIPYIDTLLRMGMARIIMEANFLGVFTALEKSEIGLTTEELAKRTELSLAGAQVLLTALNKSGYLLNKDDRYINGPWVTRWITGKDRGMPNLILLQTNVWERLSDLRTPLKTGRPTQDYHQVEATKFSKNQEVYTLAMREMAQLLLSPLLSRIKLPLGAKTLLDVGGAHGEMSRALTAKYPQLRATVMDLAGPLETARRIHEVEGNPHGVQLLEGNAMTDDWPSGWDVILLSQFIHCFNEEENFKLLTRAYECLNPGGTVIILDQFLGLSPFGDSFAAVTSVVHFTMGGKCYHLDDVKVMLKTIGFTHTSHKPYPKKSPTAVVQGWKN